MPRFKKNVIFSWLCIWANWHIKTKKDSFFILLWIFWQIKHKEWEELALWQCLKIFGSFSSEKSIPHGKGIFCSLEGHIIGLRGPVLQIPYTKLPWNSSINLIFRSVTQREKATICLKLDFFCPLSRQNAQRGEMWQKFLFSGLKFGCIWK